VTRDNDAAGDTPVLEPIPSPVPAGASQMSGAQIARVVARQRRSDLVWILAAIAIAIAFAVLWDSGLG
jgi:hypothetical protein